MPEIEVKLRADAEVARRRLADLGFQAVTPRLFERNLLFDTPTGSLRAAGQVLRLRSKGDRWWLTHKTRPEAATRHKVRQEIEIETAQGPQMGQILERLGFEPAFEYQKYRTAYRRPDDPGEVLLDETPLGTYLELEGPPDWIDATAAALGYEPADYILESYGALYLDWCREQGVSPGHMVFPEKKGLLPSER